MPASIAAANPTLVLPHMLAIAFTQSRVFQTRENVYVDGNYQSLALSITSRKSWQQSMRLTAAQITALNSFWDTVIGPLHEFIFYDVNETSPIFSYDITGSAVAGQYTVRFDGALTYAIDAGRNPVQGLKLIEVD